MRWRERVTTTPGVLPTRYLSNYKNGEPDTLETAISSKTSPFQDIIIIDIHIFDLARIAQNQVSKARTTYGGITRYLWFSLAIGVIQRGFSEQYNST